MRVVGDVGGTHVRLGVLDAAGEPTQVRSYPSADFDGPVEAIVKYLSDVGPLAPDAEGSDEPRELALAIAGPAQGEEMSFTNLHWRFSPADVRERLGLGRLEILNDFEALALSIPGLAERDREVVKEGEAAAGAPIVVLGPGTGLGAAALVPSGSGYAVVPGEGGHRDLAATTEEEWQVVRRLASWFGHVSVERVLSGPGLENLYRALGEIHGHALAETDAASIARLSRSGEALPRRATALFSGWLGALAGDLALAFGARAGVHLAGGVLGGLGEAFDRALFRERFLAKGRLRGYLEPIPVFRVVRDDAALVGCAMRLT